MIAVDVILISYNQQQYIRQAIESILMQKFDGEVEVIVADDCSTDQTLSIIREYESKSPFKFVFLEGSHNLGFHENYHRAFKACEGDYIAILEGDDWWHSDRHLQQHADFLEKHKRFSMSFNRISHYYEKNDCLELSRWGFPKDYFAISLKNQIQGNQIGNLSSCVFRTKYIQALPEKFFATDFADWELGMCMAEQGSIAYLKESTSTYRIAGKGEWTKLDKGKQRDSVLKTFESMDAYFSLKYHRLFEEGKNMFLEGISPVLYMSWKSRLKKLLGIRK